MAFKNPFDVKKDDGKDTIESMLKVIRAFFLRNNEVQKAQMVESLHTLLDANEVQFISMFPNVQNFVLKDLKKSDQDFLNTYFKVIEDELADKNKPAVVSEVDVSNIANEQKNMKLSESQVKAGEELKKIIAGRNNPENTEKESIGSVLKKDIDYVLNSFKSLGKNNPENSPVQKGSVETLNNQLKGNSSNNDNNNTINNTGVTIKNNNNDADMSKQNNQTTTNSESANQEAQKADMGSELASQIDSAKKESSNSQNASKDVSVKEDSTKEKKGILKNPFKKKEEKPTGNEQSEIKKESSENNSDVSKSDSKEDTSKGASLPTSGNAKVSNPIVNLILTQLKEVVDLVNELSTKMKEIEKTNLDVVTEFTDVKQNLSTYNGRISSLEGSIEKFIGLYEVVMNEFNPFVENDKEEKEKK